MQNKKEKILNDFYDKKKLASEQHNKDKLEKLEELENIDYEQTEDEKQLYKKFEQIAQKDPDKKFKFEHIRELGVDADVVIIYGKKGIGKTYQISKIISELAKEDPEAEVILIRNTVAEFQALEKQLTVSYSPIFLKGRTTSNNPPLFHKTFLTGNKPRYMGFCVALNGFSLESAKGAEYPNIRLIIWDECTNTGVGTAGYDRTDIERFITFLDSIIRSKNNVKVYIFGNFHRTTDGEVSDVLLDELNIPYGCTLKIREEKSEDLKNTSRMLFINTGALYSGIDSNAKVSLFGSKSIQDDLFTNLPKSYSNMVGGLNIFYSHKPCWGLIFHDGQEALLLLLSSFKRRKEDDILEINYMIHMEPFINNDAFVHTIYTSNIAIYNEFSASGLKVISKWEEWLLINDLYNYCLQKSLFYSSDVTRKLFTIQMSEWQEKYRLGDITFLHNHHSKHYYQ